MDVHATGEAFSPQKRTSSASKNEIYYLFSIFVTLWVIFALLDPDTDPGTPLNPDSDKDRDWDPQHWFEQLANDKL
jgi:hypothetical protein